MAHPEETSGFVTSHAQEMSRGVQKKHIDLYVNEFSLALGREGRDAVRQLFDLAVQSGACPVTLPDLPLFLAEQQERQEGNGK